MNKINAIASRGWKIVFLIRLSPALPYNLLNYALGLTGVRFIHSAVATLFAMMPGTLMYVYLGSVGGVLAADRERTPVEIAYFVLGLIATIVATVWITRMARRELKTHMDAEN